MSGQGLTCLGHGTFTNSGQLWLYYIMLITCSEGLGAECCLLNFDLFIIQLKLEKNSFAFSNILHLI